MEGGERMNQLVKALCIEGCFKATLHELYGIASVSPFGSMWHTHCQECGAVAEMSRDEYEYHEVRE